MDLLIAETAIWSPNPDTDGRPNPQRLALECQADELYYGGAAGGGKTDLLLGCALTQHQKSVVFRRVFPNLKAIIRRSIEIKGSEEGYKKGEKLWELGDGRFLEFGSIQHEDNKSNWQGRPHDLYCFDEITEFSRTIYQFVIGWNRTTDPNQRCRVICAGNPPLDADGMWVVEEWGPWLDEQHPDPAEPGELRWYYYDDDGQIHWKKDGDPVAIGGRSIKPRSRTFIPARLDDNPHLSADGRYLSVLNSLPEPLRTRLKDGDFKAVKNVDPWQVIPTEWVQLAQKRWRERERPSTPMTAIGVDVSRGGRDKTSIAPRFDNWFDEVISYPGVMMVDGPAVAAVVAPIVESDSVVINLDGIGVGAAAYDSMSPWANEVNAINVAEGSDHRDRSGKFKMRNLRAEIWWRMREALDPVHGDDIALPPSSQLLADLCSARYKPTTAGIMVEDKDDIKKRIGRSPDEGEAVLLSHYQVEGVSIAGLGTIYGRS